MITNLASIGIDKPIPGLAGISYNRCTTLADVLAAMVAQGGSGADVYAVSGNYDSATENIVIVLSNGSTFSIPASLLLPVVADGDTIIGNGTNANKLTGYKVAYDVATGALTITPPTGAAVTVPAQTATEEKAADPHDLLGLGAGATVTTQQMLDYLAVHLRDCCPDDTLEIPASAFADPVNPTQTEAQAWIDAQGALKAGTQIIYSRFAGGDVEDPDYVWLVNEIGDATNVESPALLGLTTNADGKASVAGDVLNVPNPLPVASFTQTSQIGLTAAYSAAASSGTQQGNGLTYAWTVTARAGTTGTGTPATPTAATTNITFSESGQYDVTLTVTDANGATATETQTIAVDRVLYVGGTEADRFATLQAAFDWITSAANVADSANVALYRIEVQGVPLDTVEVVPNQARVLFYPGAVLGIGVNFPAGSYTWAGLSPVTGGISPATGSAVKIVTAGSNVTFSGLSITGSDPTVPTIDANGAGALRLQDCTVNGQSALMAVSLVGLTSTIRIFSCLFRGKVLISGCDNPISHLIGSEIFANAGVSCLEILDSTFSAVGNRLMVAGSGAVVCACIDVSAPTAAARFVLLDGNICRVNTTTGAQPAKGIEIAGGGAGAVRVVGNLIHAEPTNGIGLHLVGAFPADLVVSNNQIEGTQDAVLSTSDGAGALPLVQTNVPFYNNIYKGNITNVTFGAGTVLPGGNIQV